MNKHYLDLYLVTFNCARTRVPVDLFARHLFHSLPSPSSGGAEDNNETYTTPELIVFNLQEIAPVTDSFLGGSFLGPYFDAFSQAVDRAVLKKDWDSHYVNLVRVNSGMTALMVFVRSDIADRISWVDTAQVGVGVQQMGNKGAAGARLGYLPVDTSQRTLDLTFVAAHLAPMEYNVELRNKDYREIAERLVFTRKVAIHRTRMENVEDSDEPEEEAQGSESEDHPQGIFTPTSYLFIGGDLNYRTSDILPQGDDHTRYPILDAEETSPSHYSQLLKKDQLLRERRQGKSFHGLNEAPIRFGPTYKYSAAARRAAAATVVDGTWKEEWKFANYRWPSWTDRILYLDTPPWMPELGHVKPHVYNALPLIPTSDHRPVALSVSIPKNIIRKPQGTENEDDVRLRPPVEIDPAWYEKRSSARSKEIIVGYLGYLSLTWQGGGMVLATIVGAVGIWIVLRTLLG